MTSITVPVSPLTILSSVLPSRMRYPPHFGPDTFPNQRIELENEHCVFLRFTKQAVLPGSGLIVPYRPCESVFDLTLEEWAATFELLGEVKRLLAESAPDGYNVGWNVGRVGGQSIPQVHLHVIPRFADEPLAGRGIRYHLKQPENRRPGPDAAPD